MSTKTEPAGVAEDASIFADLCAREPPAWKLEDAKARFSEVVRRARSDGPQRVTLRGRDTVVVLSAEDFARLAPRDERVTPFVAFMEGLGLEGLDLTRAPDTGRDVDL